MGDPVRICGASQALRVAVGNKTVHHSLLNTFRMTMYMRLDARKHRITHVCVHERCARVYVYENKHVGRKHRRPQNVPAPDLG